MKKLARRLLLSCLGLDWPYRAGRSNHRRLLRRSRPPRRPRSRRRPSRRRPRRPRRRRPRGPPRRPRPPPAASEGVEQIVVTGSAIRRRDLITPAPVSILDRIDLDAAGSVSLGEILQRIPEQGNGINVQFNNGGDGSTRVNLRSLGVSRTLVLLNGRRIVNGGIGADTSVDLNVDSAGDRRARRGPEGRRLGDLRLRRDRRRGEPHHQASGSRAPRPRRTPASPATATRFTYDINATSGIASSKGGVLFSVGYYRQDDLFSRRRPWADVPISSRPRTIGRPACLTPQGSSAIPPGRFSAQVAACTALDLKCTGNSAYQALTAIFPSASDASSTTRRRRSAGGRTTRTGISDARAPATPTTSRR